MGTNGKRRWRISIFRSNSSSSKLEPNKSPPSEFLCPISRSLMSDPVVLSSGQTLERTTVHVCKHLGFYPHSPTPDFDTIIPNLALKSTILKWCDDNGTLHPSPPDYSSVEKILREMMISSKEPEIRDSERELLRNMSDTPTSLFSHAATELNHRVGSFGDSGSSVESVIANANIPATPLLPFATRPMCFSPGSTSSELENLSLSTPEDEELVSRLYNNDIYEHEQGLISLRKLTRTKVEARISFSTPRVLSILKSLLASRYATVQTNAAAVIVNLSLEKPNKVKIVRSGLIPPVIDLLKGGFPESQEHAAGAIFSLALEDENKTAIGVLGALQPLLHAMRSDSERTRHDSVLALYHLTLAQSNRVKLIKLGAVSLLLTLVRSGDMAGRVMLVLCNLAACVEGRSAMLEGNAVEVLVRTMGEIESEATKENCVAALYSLSQGSLRFKALAREARAGEVLREVEEKGGSERMKEKARKVLAAMRWREEEEAEEEVDWEGLLEGGISRTRYRVTRNTCGANSTEF